MRVLAKTGSHSAGSVEMVMKGSSMGGWAVAKAPREDGPNKKGAETKHHNLSLHLHPIDQAQQKVRLAKKSKSYDLKGQPPKHRAGYRRSNSMKGKAENDQYRRTKKIKFLVRTSY